MGVIYDCHIDTTCFQPATGYCVLPQFGCYLGCLIRFSMASAMSLLILTRYEMSYGIRCQ